MNTIATLNAAFDASKGVSMDVLGTASQQWSSRPMDERFLSLIDMDSFVSGEHARAEQVVRANRDVTFEAVEDGSHRGLFAMVEGPRERSQVRGDRVPVDPTHWSFGQLANLAGAPAGFLRDLPAELTADILNYRLTVDRQVEEIGMLFRRPIDNDSNAHRTIAAATGPGYGRIFNDSIVKALRRHFGDGRTGQWRVPGEFGREVAVTKDNTTLYASDRDMFVFLTDERNPIEVKNRRDGKPGTMSRGFYIYNSEVGSSKFGLASFFLDYVCMNRNIWGVEGFEEITFRHSSGAPHRFIERAMPLLERYSRSGTVEITTQIAAAQAAKVDNVADFLAKRKFTKSTIEAVQKAHTKDEGRPIETLFDLSNGITAHARSIEYQDERVALERKAGEIFALAK
jgi:hypothetical protein